LSYHVKPNHCIHVSISTQYGLQSENNGQMPPMNNDNCDGFIPDDQLARILQQREANAIENNNHEEVVGQLNEQVQHPSSFSPRPEEEFDSRDFACGFFLGLLLGVYSFFLMMFSRRYRSRRFRLGIIVGGMFNIFINAIFRNDLNNNNNNNDHKTDNESQNVS